MKLKLPQIFGQRDSQWANVILGYNTDSKYNIGLYGCLITCFGSYLGKTPTGINDLLKANGGFAPGTGNFIWSKCIVLGLNETHVSTRYVGPVTDVGIAKIKSFLDQGFPLLAEIDFNPATTAEEMHFILICGYENNNIFCFDPWTAQVISLDVYGGAARAIIQFRAYDRTLPFDTADDPLVACMKDRETFWKALDEKSRQYAELDQRYTLLLAENSKLKNENEQLTKNNIDLTNTSSIQLENFNKQSEGVSANLKTVTEERDKLKEQLGQTDNQNLKQIEELTKTNSGLNIKVEELTTEKNSLVNFQVVVKNKKMKIALIKVVADGFIPYTVTMKDGKLVGKKVFN